MSRLGVFCILCLCLIFAVIGYDFPADRKRPCYCDRYSPIALITSSAKPIRAPELEINLSEDAEIRFVNNITVQGVIGAVVKGSINVTGGPLYGDSYYLSNVLYRVDAVANQTRVYGTHDGVGVPIAFELFCNNRAYPESDVRKYPDGILNIVFSVLVEGTVDNTEFAKFAPALRHVRRVNSTYTISAKNSLSWLLETLRKNCYYAYPGSANNPVNVELSPSQIVIEPNARKRPFISYGQFYETFLKVENNFGQVLTNVLSSYQQGNRPVVEICNPVKVNWHPAKGCEFSAGRQKQASGNGFPSQSQYQG